MLATVQLLWLPLALRGGRANSNVGWSSVEGLLFHFLPRDYIIPPTSP